MSDESICQTRLKFYNKRYVEIPSYYGSGLLIYLFLLYFMRILVDIPVYAYLNLSDLCLLIDF